MTADTRAEKVTVLKAISILEKLLPDGFAVGIVRVPSDSESKP